jgi:hypothetical protein
MHGTVTQGANCTRGYVALDASLCSCPLLPRAGERRAEVEKCSIYDEEVAWPARDYHVA